MANLLIVLYEVVWIRESISKHQRQELIISFYRKVMLRTQVIPEALHY